VGPNDQLVGEKVEATRKNSHIGSLQVRVDRLGASGKEGLHLAGEKHLHARGSALDGDVFCIQIVFLENILVLGRPQNRVNVGAEPSAGGAEFFRGDKLPVQLKEQNNDQRLPQPPQEKSPSISEC